MTYNVLLIVGTMYDNRKDIKIWVVDIHDDEQLAAYAQNNIYSVSSNNTEIGQVDVTQKSITTFNAPNPIITSKFIMSQQTTHKYFSYVNGDEVEVASLRLGVPQYTRIKIAAGLSEGEKKNFDYFIDSQLITNCVKNSQLCSSAD